MTNSLSQRLALLFSLLTVVELLSLVALAPLDAAVAQWIETHRSCEFDHIMFLVEDHPLTLLFILGGLRLVVFIYLGRWREASHLLLIVLAGSFFCELLKTGFERARPSVLPSLTVGNSFPSGHVTTALYIAGAVGFVLWRSSWPNACKIIGMSVLGLLASMTAWQRLYLGHHWCTDVIGSTLFVGAWLCFALPRPRLFSFSQRTVLTCVGAFASYAMFYFFPALRLSLPTAHAAVGEPAVSLNFGKNGSHELFRGSWGDDTQDSTRLVTWLTREEASVEVLLPQHQDYLLKIAIRPLVQSKAFACFPLEIRVNRQHASTLFLDRGWREYALHLDADWLIPGQNLLTFHADPTFAGESAEPRTVVFYYLRLFADQTGRH